MTMEVMLMPAPLTMAAVAGAGAATATWVAVRAGYRQTARRLERFVDTRRGAGGDNLRWFPILQKPAQVLHAWARALPLRGAMRERQEQVSRALPFFLDLMVIAMDGGLNLHQAVEAVAPNLPAGPLRAAIDQARADMRLGRPALEALAEMADQVAVDDVRSFVRTLRIGQALGTPVSAALRQSARLIRQRRRQRLDERLGVLPLKMTFCALLLFFPPIFVLLLLPNVLNFIHGQW